MRVLWLTGVIVLLDQATKWLVVQTMYRSQTIPLLGDWLSLTYTENPGMAFGITFGHPGLITYFSICATAVIFIYLITIRRGFAPYRSSLSLVLGGALGNIIDRVFYGPLIYGEPFFQGRVVDFIHVNVWRGYLPESLPVIGGQYVALFPIWNVADMSIVVGVVGILIFQKAFHSRQLQVETTAVEPEDREAAEAVLEGAHEGRLDPASGYGVESATRVSLNSQPRDGAPPQGTTSSSKSSPADPTTRA